MPIQFYSSREESAFILLYFHREPRGLGVCKLLFLLLFLFWRHFAKHFKLAIVPVGLIVDGIGWNL